MLLETRSAERTICRHLDLRQPIDVLTPCLSRLTLAACIAFTTKPGGFMLSTAQLLTLAKAKAGDVTDYRLAKLIGVPHSTISSYRNGNSKPANPIAMRLAELAGTDPVETIAAVNIERASTDDDRRVWELILSRCTH